MPASYAHQRFGKQLLEQMPSEIRQCIQRFRRMYDMGLQGPDIFFYYLPFLDTAPGKLGKQYHRMTGKDFFAQVCPKADSEAARAYLYGLLAHYCLDSACHPFVNKVVADGEAVHAALEAEFDRYLMAMDGIPEPHRHDRTRKMKLTRGECMTVAEFYPPATGGNVHLSVWSMAKALRYLSGGKRQKREKLLNTLKSPFLDHFVPEAPMEKYARMDSELLARYNRSLRLYPELLAQLEAHRKYGALLEEAFTPAFG